jgi:hypothetical protein
MTVADRDVDTLREADELLVRMGALDQARAVRALAAKLVEYEKALREIADGDEGRMSEQHMRQIADAALAAQEGEGR